MAHEIEPGGDAGRVKVPPHSVEAEQAVLGGLMLDNSGWEVVADLITANDFYRSEHRLIFQAGERLIEQDKPLDMVTLGEWLEQSGDLEACGGLAYLGQLAEQTPGASNIRSYAEIVKERSILRQLVEVSGQIADSAFNPRGRSSAELLDDAESRVFRIAEDQVQQGGGPRAINPILKETLSRIEELFESEGGLTGLTSGFKDLDDMTSGWQPSDLVIVAGRPSMGKTAFAMNLVENALMATEQSVLVFSMEMPADAIVMRMLSSIGRINQTRIRSGNLEQEDWPRLTSAISLLKNKPLYIDDTPALSPTEMRSRARRIARESGNLGMVMVDYLQLMSSPGAESRQQEVSAISRGIKALARELNVPVVCLSQLNRASEAREGHRPRMSDLRESGSIEQDADVVMMLHREDYYHKGDEDYEPNNVAEVIVAKQRNGPTGTVKLLFHGPTVRFDNLADPQRYGGDDGVPI